MLFSCLIQPFPIHFNCNDYHIIIFFDGHPEYESIEAMIQEREGQDAYIRAIITFHNKMQIDHINDPNIYKELSSNNNRKICYTPIQYLHNKKCFKNHFNLKFTSFNGEEIIMDFYPSSKPSAKYAKLIDPLGHSTTISLPVMRPMKSTLIGPKSTIFINGNQYKIPIKVRVPLFFTGLNGFFSEIFNIGILRAGKKTLSLTQSPDSLVLGKQWVYKSDNETLIYEITHIKDSDITIKSKNEKLELEMTEFGLVLKAIYVYSSCKTYKNAEFSIHFSPFIVIKPSAINTLENRNTFFSITINNYNSLITGISYEEIDKNSSKILLQPIKPSWAVERNVSISIQTSDNNFFVSTEVINNTKES